MKVRDVIKKLREDGWVHVGTEGSHRQYEHPAKPGKTTVSGHPSAEVKPVYEQGIRVGQSCAGAAADGGRKGKAGEA